MKNLSISIFILFCLVILTSSCGEKEEKKLNVLFIAVDDLRPQLGSFGVSGVISPNIDRLAAMGTIFPEAYCNIPVCGASRASILTGLRPTINRFLSFDTRIDEQAPGVTTLPGHFKANGYYTITNGKVAHHKGDCIGAWDEEWRPKGPGRNFLIPENAAMDAVEGQRGPAWENADVPDSAYHDGKIALKAISDLKRLKEKDQPFFLAVGFKKPHLPFNAPTKYWDMYDPEKIGLADNPFKPEKAPDQAMHNFGELRNYSGIPQEGPVSDSVALNLRHGYHACVSYMDAQLGLVLDELERLDLADNTIIVLWGDHGWNLGEHGLWCKHCNFHTSINAPLIVAAPGFKGGQKALTRAEFVDIYPTICELAGLPLPGHLQGKSFVSVMDDPNSSHKDFALSKWYNGLTIVKDQFHYTEWRNKDDSLYARMLYDHSKDPHENVNVVGEEKYQEDIVVLSAIMKANRGEGYLVE
ncbi:MAG: sulfatase [Cyclobacteriaceae bacterium]|nr:sulfatase [Cyclobacteriaceae bacterium SS2]